MKVLIVKTTSLGDVIHCLPAVTDALKQNPDITFDWVVEESFREVVSWHGGIRNIFPVATRRWRKKPLQAVKEIFQFLKQLRKEKYDIVIDAQGLMKSAFISRLAKSKQIAGYDKKSIKEPVASYIYNQKINVNCDQHAVIRNRILFAGALNYPQQVNNQEVKLPLDYGLSGQFKKDKTLENPYIIFLHATTWNSKHWPEHYWVELGKLLNREGYVIYLPWGNDAERRQAEAIAANLEAASVLPRLTLTEVANVLHNADAAVAVDTGLGHLSAALSLPCVSIYGATDAFKTGAMGNNQCLLSAEYPCSPCFGKNCHFDAAEHQTYPPCYKTLSSTMVYGHLKKLLTEGKKSS